MKDLFRDTLTGDFFHVISKGKFLPYAEDKDPSLWKRYVDKEKSGRMARHGTTGEERNEEEKGDDGSSSDNAEQGTNDAYNEQDTRNSSNTRVDSGEQPRNDVSGVKVDPEKGRDVTIVTWFSDNDPEVRSPTSSLLQTVFNSLLEPAKLVNPKEILRNFLDLLFDLFHLHWFCHLLCWRNGRRTTIWCQSGCCHSRTYSLRCWIRFRTYDLGSNV